MAGPISLNSPLNVNAGGSDVTGQLENMIGQVQGLTSDFANKLTDPGFNQKSEMSQMLRLQREMSLESMMYQTLSNCEKSRSDCGKAAANNIK
jgi:hypothetical protein